VDRCLTRGLTRMVYNTGVMTHFDSWRFSSGASLVAVAALLCLLGAYLSSSATGPDVPATLTMAHSPHMEPGANGFPLTGSYLAVPAEEAENDDKGPVNPGLLTALLLAFFFGMAAGWPLANGRGHQVFCASSAALRPLFVPCQGSPSLGVFRL
jgi:hypothetical protein